MKERLKIQGKIHFVFHLAIILFEMKTTQTVTHKILMINSKSTIPLCHDQQIIHQKITSAQSFDPKN